MLGSFSGIDAWSSQKIETTQKVSVETSEEELMESIALALNDENVISLIDRKKYRNRIP